MKIGLKVKKKKQSRNRLMSTESGETLCTSAATLCGRPGLFSAGSKWKTRVLSSPPWYCSQSHAFSVNCEADN